jgi:hypothetical protein
MANIKPKNNQRPDRAGNKKAGNSPDLTPEQQRIVLAKSLGIKPKTKEFIDLMQADPKLSATEAYIRTHQTINRNTAKVEASKLLTKPNVSIYKASIVKKAKTKIGLLIDSSNESIALKASQDVIDRTEGKAIQKNETTSKVVTVKLDLSGLKLGAHYVAPELNSP